MLADAALSATLLGRTDTAVPEFEEAIAVDREVGDKSTKIARAMGTRVDTPPP